MKAEIYHLTFDIFEENYLVYKKTRLAKRLYNKYTPRPYYLRYKTMRAFAYFASYWFNIFSAVTASTLVYFFVKNLTGGTWIAVTATIVFLGLLEVSKRLVTQAVFHDQLTKSSLNISMSALAATLTVLSISFSYFGSKRLVTTLTPPVVQITTDSLIAPFQDRIAALTLQIEQARNTKRRGITTVSSQRTIETLTGQIAQLETEILRVTRTVEDKNEHLLSVHNTQTTASARNFALITLLLELLFLLCAWYLEYYDFRSYIEFLRDKQLVDKPAQTGKNNYRPGRKQQLTQTRMNPQKTTALSKSQIAKIKSQMATARYRLKNGIGKKETAKMNLRRLSELLSARDLS